MKKNLLFLLAVMAMSMTLNARVVLIDEGFENGIQEDVWTQEKVRGDKLWEVEDLAQDLKYPASVIQGTKRACLRNTTGETLGYVTRLVSKVMDLRPTKVYMPELTFYFANPKWGADRDTLRVLYRTSSRGQWKPLGEFESTGSDWQRVKLSLPEVGQTYQIAFEGTDNLGRGIVLDSIKLQSAPECTIPYDLMATNKGAGKVNLAWTASYDADYWELIVTKDTIDPDLINEIETLTPEKVIYHGLVSDETNKDLLLEAGEFYLAYVRSLCEEENSAWSSEATKDGPYGFRVRTTKQIPFTETFNYPKNVFRDTDWSWGSNTGKTNPYVNSTTQGTARANYSKDTTAAVIFSGGTTMQPEELIPADRYAYMATPALTDTNNANFKLNQCQVHFWSTVYTYTGRQYGRSIIVGVMNDPDDITTFEPIDTITVWGNKTFVESIVDLGGYEGTGSYVAFVSDFDRNNLFYLDNLTIEYRKDVNKVTDIVVNPRDTYATITWKGNASSYNVLITNVEVNPSSPAADAIVDQATVTTNSYVCQALEADHSWNRPYYVYVKAAGQEWSYRYPFVTIASQRVIPYRYDFESSAATTYQIGTKQYAKSLGIFGNSGSYPSIEVGSTKSYVGNGYLYLSQMGGKDSWITLPMVENLDSVQVKFYLSGYETPNQAHASVGVMTNPMDINTYTKVADFQLNATGYTRCYANFENYSGPEGIIAIVWEDVANMSMFTNNYIDELAVEKLSECVPPTNIDIQIEPDSIAVSWDESDLSDEWELFISRIALKESDRMGKTMAEIAAMPGVVVAQALTWSQPGVRPQFGIPGLNPHTNYYLYIRATCDMTWWTEAAFTTPCREEEFPFKETFETYSLGGTVAGCWQLADYLGVGYPKLVQAGGSKALDLYSSGTTHRSIAIVPKVEGELSNMVLSLSARTAEGTASSTGVLYIGTMEDINIQNTFVPFDTLYVSGTEFKKVSLILANYDLVNDNIAITTGIGSLTMNSEVVIDNVELKDPSCIEAYDFVQTNLAPHSIDLSWSGRTDDGTWQITVLTSNVSINSVMNHTYKQSAVVVEDTVVAGQSFSLAGLQATKNYYVYVRALCGDSIWASTSARTTCEPLNPNKANKETFEAYSSGTTYDDAYQAQCWTVGNEDPTYTSGSARPFLYSSSTYATSGSNSYRLYPLSGATACYIASPEIDIDTMSHIVASYSYYTSSSYALIAGVMRDPTDLSTFVVLDSFMTATGKNQVTMDLSEYASLIPPTAKYFAVRSAYGATAPTIYLDDFSFISNACPMPKPSISELTTGSVRVSSGLRTSDPWIIWVTNTPISDANLEKDDYVVPRNQLVYCDTINRRSVTVTGLDAQSQYYVYTATLCDSVTKSQWASLSFMTPCRAWTPEELGIITFSTEEGYSTGTAGEMPCWTKGSKTANASASYIPYIGNTASYKHNDNNYLYLHDYVYGTSSYYVGGYAIMPALEVDSINKYQVNFWGRGYNSDSYTNRVIVGIISDPSDLNTFVAVDTLNLSKSAWDPFSVGFENYEGDYMGNMGTNIMFLLDFGTSAYAYISEISVELIPHCRAVGAFTVDSVGENAAVVSWKGYQDTYRVLVSPRLLTEEEKPKYHYLIDTIVNTSEDFLLQGLEPTTNYYIYAQGICGGGDSTAISVTYATVRTTCPMETGVPVPFYDDFESYELNDDQPGCWQFLYTGSYSSWFAVKQVSSNGSKAIDVYSSTNSAYAVVPKVDANLDELKLTFDARSYGGSTATKMYVGVMADVNDVNTFVLLETFDLAATTEFTHCTMLLGEYELPYDNLVITAGIQNVTPNRYDVFLDNVGLDYVNSCNAPKMKTIGTTFTTAELMLTPVMSTDSLWEIVVISEADYDLIGNIALYLESAEKMRLDSTHIVLTGLQQATSYYVYARTICSEEDKSAWSRNPLKFNTQFYYESSYFFGFEKSPELWQRSKYSESDNYYLHPALVADRDGQGAETQSYLYYPHALEKTDSVLYARTGDGALRMQADDDFYGEYIIFPTIGVATDRSFEFKVRQGAIDAVSKLPKGSTDAVFEIGTIDVGTSFDTYQPLATIRLKKLDPAAAASKKNNQLFSNYTLDLDANTMAAKQLVFHMPKQKDDTVALFFDDVKLDAAKGFSLVAINKVVPAGTSAMVEWANVGGPWNLTITTANGQTMAQYTNLTAPSQLVENLEPQTDYIAVLAPATVPSGASGYITSDKMAFRTLCPTMEPNSGATDFVWNFDNADEWEANDILAGDAYDDLYFKPSCFQVGITYDKPVNGFQWLIQRKGYSGIGALTTYDASAHIELGRNDSHSLRINTAVNTANAYFNSYIVLPALDCDFETMMLEFYGRCFTNFDDTYPTASARGKITAAAWLGSDYSQSIVIGTLTDPTDFSTLQVLDTLTYSHTQLTTNDNVHNDPAGLRYWELMQLPLDNAKGKYIVLFQPAPGLFYIDDMSVKPIGNTLFKPKNPHITNLTSTTVTLEWGVYQPQFGSVVVLLDAMGEEVSRTAVSGTSCELTGLQPAMNYSWYVYQVNGNEQSPATKPQTFATECVTITPAYTCGFEPEEGWKYIDGQTAVTQTLCWTYSDADQHEWKNVNYDPYNQENTSSYNYAYEGSHALVMRATTSSRLTYQPYIALPAMDVTAYDTLQVSFWMRPAYVYAATDSVAQSYTGSTYAKSVIVGTMTDPNNAATFVPLDTVTYDGTLSIADKAIPENDFLFQRMSVELVGARGPYVAIMTSFQEKGSTTKKSADNIWIDNISFEHKQECKTPTDLEALQVGAVHAVLHWNGIDSAGSYLVQVSTDPYFIKEDAFVFNAEVKSNTCKVTDLSPLTSYVWRVQAICGEKWGESSFSQKATFKTSRSPYFYEPFTTAVNNNEWLFSKAHADNVVDTTGIISRGLDSWGFVRTVKNFAFNNSHYVAQGYNNDYHWMITPDIYLPEDDSVHFSVDIALTACNTAHTETANAVNDNDMKDDYYFMIILSEDGGKTWKSKNILAKWQNTNPEGQQLRDIPSTGMNMRFSLAAYAGKNVRIGFYREARSSSPTGIAIHVDNVRFAYFDKTVDYASTCQYEDITIGGIHLSGDAEPGIHAYPVPYYVPDEQAKAGKRDSVQQLEIEVFPAMETFFADTICEGDTYTSHDFLPKERTGIYRRKLHTVGHGCDSIVTLDLYVKPTRYAPDTEVSICRGESFEWNGKIYNRAGLFRDTLVSSIGCDSIETLVVSYYEGGAAVQTFHDSTRVSINELPFTYQNALYPYAEGQEPIYYPAGTPKGVYVDTVKIQGEYCTNILIHTLTIYDPKDAIDTIFDGKGETRKVVYHDQLYIICNDEWYNALGQKVADPRK